MNDFLEARTMNLNVRVSPMMKLELTERAKRIGLNITDFIYVAIAKSESMDRDTENVNAEKLKLKQQVKDLQSQLSRYDTLIEPLAKQLVGKEITDTKGKVVLIKDKFLLAETIFNNFQTQTKWAKLF